MVRAPCVIKHKVESCPDKHYNDCWYSVFSSSGVEKSLHQGVVAFTLTSVNQARAEQSCNDIPHRQQPRRKSSKPVLDSCSSINQRLSAAILGTLLLGQRLQRFLLSINGPTLECPASQYCISIIIGRLHGPRLC